MSFDAGTRLGPYEIIARLGAGGMGEVYRARDTRLDRTVALKVLTDALATDSESRQRFEQEARAIASLNDPHICTIHDVGRHGELDYLVLEYLEGETLADRLLRTPPLSRGEILAIATQIADALDRAHRAGIVHRDLKPGNVMLVRRPGASNTPDVKLLDFGLAARTAAVRQPALGASLAATMAPSVLATQPAAKASTAFSGTVPYMAPEQIDGDIGDGRVDIFAFGCVLYEMLAGRKAFEGTNALTVIAAVMSNEPAPVAGLAENDPLLDHLMRRCLEKDRERRWQSIRDVAAQLRWLMAHPERSAAAEMPRARVSGFSLAAACAVAGLVIGAGIAGLIAMRQGTAAATTDPITLEIPTGPTDDAAVALSPDGRQIAFIANQDREPMLWVRSLASLDSRVLPGTRGASRPFWSPDSRTIGFFADGKLKRVDVAGGDPLVVATAQNGRGGTWNADGVILFSPGVNGPILRVAATGGAVETVVTGERTGVPDTRFPQFLPDGRRFLFSSTLGTLDTNGVYLASLDDPSPVRVLATENVGFFAAPDRLLTITQNTLRAYHFDVGSGTVDGQPAIVAQDLAGFSTSTTGVLAYRSGTAQNRQLQWMDRKGTVLGTVGDVDTAALASPDLSPDERTVVVFRQPKDDNDIWVIELARGLGRAITNSPPADAHPTWDATGQWLIFNSRRFTSGAVRAAFSGGMPEPLFTKGETGLALNASRDGKYILLRRGGETTGFDLVAVPLAGNGSEVVVTNQRGDQPEGQFSPDGRWVAYVSDESGSPEVFVQSFPAGTGRTQLSTAGGSQVRWSADGREVFYVAPDGRLMSVALVQSDTALDVKPPVPLFQTHLASGTNVLGIKPQYAVTRDGRFLINTAVERPSAPIVVSTGWTQSTAAFR